MKNVFIVFLILWIKVGIVDAEELAKQLPASLEQRIYLAQSVCQDLFEDPFQDLGEEKNVRDDRTTCEINFLSHNRNSEKPPKLTIKERTEEKISFTITPSKYTQLVTLVNENNNNGIIYYSLVISNEKPDPLYFDPLGSYTFWTAVLSSTGIPSLWKRGPNVVSWAQIQRDNSLHNDENNYAKNYDIKFNFLVYENDTKYINAQFWWNSSDPSDLYFDVLNNCNKGIQGDFYDKKIGPESNRTVILQRLPLSDTCTMLVRGKYNITKFIYHTPACDDLTHCEPLPEFAENITMQASQESNYTNLWSVRVQWAKPRRAPIDYNVTLRANNVQSVVVPGDVTEAEFKNVEGEWLYNVSVAARNNKGTAFTSRRNLFRSFSSPTDYMIGASWAVAILTMSALLMVILYVRRRLTAKFSSKIYFPGVLEKITEDCDADAGGPESGSEDQWEVRPEHLLLHEVIGEGAFGVVRRGTLASTNKSVAVKMLKDFPSLEEIRSFRTEMELMKSVGAHPHVVSLVGCYSGRRPLIVAEYCGRGDLLSYLRCSWDLMLSKRNAKYYNNNKEISKCHNDLLKNKPDPTFVANRLYELQGVCDTELTLLDLLSFCRQIAMGMEFLASNRVVHRDLAARNILVTTDRTLKIADFGLSRDVYQENQYKQKSNGKMPVKWMALESLTHRIYTTQTDVWSFGVVMWEVVTVGGAPYAGVSAARLPRLLAARYRMPRPHNCSAPLYELMLSCWNERPRSRPTFSELHAALDELLCASADHYLSLTLPVFVPDVTPEAPLSRYVRNLMRGKRRNPKIYERPLTAPTNHYTTQPAPLILT